MDPENQVQQTYGHFGGLAVTNLIKLNQPYMISKSADKSYRDIIGDTRNSSLNSLMLNLLNNARHESSGNKIFELKDENMINIVAVKTEGEGKDAFITSVIIESKDGHYEIERPDPDKNDNQLQIYNFNLGEGDDWGMRSHRKRKENVWGDYIDDKVVNDLSRVIHYPEITGNAKLSNLYTAFQQQVEADIERRFNLTQEQGGVLDNFSIQNITGVNYFKKPDFPNRNFSIDRNETTSESFFDVHMGGEYGFTKEQKTKDPETGEWSDWLNVPMYNNPKYPNFSNAFKHAGNSDATKFYMETVLEDIARNGSLEGVFKNGVWDLDVLANAGIHINKTARGTYVSIDTKTISKKDESNNYYDKNRKVPINFKVEDSGGRWAYGGTSLNFNQQLTQALTDALINNTSGGQQTIAATLSGDVENPIYRTKKDNEQVKFKNMNGSFILTYSFPVPWSDEPSTVFYNPNVKFQSEVEVDQAVDFYNQNITNLYRRDNEEDTLKAIGHLDLIKQEDEDGNSLTLTAWDKNASTKSGEYVFDSKILPSYEKIQDWQS